LIYSVGLYDYLPDKVLKRLLTAQMNLLKPGGRMILAFKDAEAYDKTMYDWGCDWQFVKRTEPEVLDLLDDLGIGADMVTPSRDQSGIILFCAITKR
jgi:extracellular factor (EF) 3-hydroxypalmitic acid methyl ester biosynthesis protein